jgi:hypothetical protein
MAIESELRRMPNAARSRGVLAVTTSPTYGADVRQGESLIA